MVLMERQHLSSGLAVHLTSGFFSTQTNLLQNINGGKALLQSLCMYCFSYSMSLSTGAALNQGTVTQPRASQLWHQSTSLSPFFPQAPLPVPALRWCLPLLHQCSGQHKREIPRALLTLPFQPQTCSHEGNQLLKQIPIGTAQKKVLPVLAQQSSSGGTMHNTPQGHQE